jgi:hypothetical protein
MFRPAIEDDSILLQDRTFLTIHFGALLVIVRLTISERSCIPSRKHSGYALAVAINFFQAGTARRSGPVSGRVSKFSEESPGQY